MRAVPAGRLSDMSAVPVEGVNFGKIDAIDLTYGAYLFSWTEAGLLVNEGDSLVLYQIQE